MSVKFLQCVIRKYGLPMIIMALLWPPLEVKSHTVVTGTVKDAAGETLPGVNVIIKGTTTGAATDAVGRYSLEVADGSSLMVFSVIGYAMREEAMAGRSVLDVTLAFEPMTAFLNAYAAVEKSNPTTDRECIAFTPGDYQFSPYEVLVPIPENERWINAKLTQNDGYDECQNPRLVA